MEASRASSILTLSRISRGVVTSILASVVIFIHRVSSQFPGGRKPREHLNGFDSQSGSQEYYKLDTRDFTSTTEILLFPLPFMVVGFGGAGLQLHYFQFLAQGTIFCVKLCRIFRSVTYLEIFLRHFGYCHSLVPDTSATVTALCLTRILLENPAIIF